MFNGLINTELVMDHTNLKNPQKLNTEIKERRKELRFSTKIGRFDGDSTVINGGEGKRGCQKKIKGRGRREIKQRKREKYKIIDEIFWVLFV